MSTPATPVLELSGHSVAFDGTAVTREVSWRVLPGRVHAVVGESGSGKSVTALSLLGLAGDTATASGSARLADGTELVGLGNAELRSIRGRRIGIVFQEPMSAFDPMFRVGDQIAEALSAHGEKVSRAHARDRVAVQLAAVGVNDPARIAASYPHELSGGQLQRAMIALATINDPEIVIADEPTTALDVTVQAGILDLLARIAKERAVVLITHDMGVVADIADEVTVMRAGRVVESGTAEDVFYSPGEDYTRALLAAVPRLEGVGEGPTASAEVVSRESSPTEAAPAGSSPAGSSPAARLTGARVVHKGKPPVTALAGVDLSIGSGEILGLVGESGSGKSTIANVLIGAQKLTAGAAEVAGEPITARDSKAARLRRAAIGTVFQDPAGSLNPRRTLAAQLAQPLLVHSTLSKPEIRSRITGLLDDVRLPGSYAERYPHELSGGQRQRVAIARALTLEPRLLIADEPTSALDVSVQAEVLELLADLHAKHGFASLFISHDLAVVEQIASRVVVLKDGNVVEEGPAAQVLSHPRAEYTRALIEAAPVPDPKVQATRRAARLAASA